MPEFKARKDGILEREWDGERIMNRRLCAADMCVMDREFSIGVRLGIFFLELFSYYVFLSRLGSMQWSLGRELMSLLSCNLMLMPVT